MAAAAPFNVDERVAGDGFGTDAVSPCTFSRVGTQSRFTRDGSGSILARSRTLSSVQAAVPV
jgi:hypothetical protein